MWGSINRRLIIQANLGKQQDPLSKITRTRKAHGLPQAVEYLASKHKPLVQIQETPKKKITS
jgi:hypothetical protein